MRATFAHRTGSARRFPVRRGHPAWAAGMPRMDAGFGCDVGSGFGGAGSALRLAASPVVRQFTGRQRDGDLAAVRRARRRTAELLLLAAAVAGGL
jgi:hypothetical protein